jgi:hypothetical protein
MATYEEQALIFAKSATERHRRAPEWVQADAALSQTYATLALMADVRSVANVLSQIVEGLPSQSSGTIEP